MPSFVLGSAALCDQKVNHIFFLVIAIIYLSACAPKLSEPILVFESRIQNDELRAGFEYGLDIHPAGIYLIEAWQEGINSRLTVVGPKLDQQFDLIYQVRGPETAVVNLSSAPVKIRLELIMGARGGVVHLKIFRLLEDYPADQTRIAAERYLTQANRLIESWDAIIWEPKAEHAREAMVRFETLGLEERAAWASFVTGFIHYGYLQNWKEARRYASKSVNGLFGKDKPLLLAWARTLVAIIVPSAMVVHLTAEKEELHSEVAHLSRPNATVFTLPLELTRGGEGVDGYIVLVANKPSTVVLKISAKPWRDQVDQFGVSFRLGSQDFSNSDAKVTPEGYIQIGLNSAVLSPGIAEVRLSGDGVELVQYRVEVTN